MKNLFTFILTIFCLSASAQFNGQMPGNILPSYSFNNAYQFWGNAYHHYADRDTTNTFKGAWNNFTGKIAIGFTGTSPSNASLDVGGLQSYSSVSNTVGFFSINANGSSGVGAQNMSSGTSASFKYFIQDSNGALFAMNQPGVNNSGSLLGLTQSTTAYITSQGRDLGIGTPDTHALYLATNNTYRLKIDGSTGAFTMFTPLLVDGILSTGTTGTQGGVNIVGSTANGTLITVPATAWAGTLTLPGTAPASGNVMAFTSGGIGSWLTPGTVTSVTSANSDIGVATTTTTPVLTWNRAMSPTLTGIHTFNSTLSSSGGFAYGQNITGTLTATANNDILAGINISPTFVPGSFTNVISAAIGVGGDIVPLGTSATYNLGSASQEWLNLTSRGINAAFYKGISGSSLSFTTADNTSDIKFQLNSTSVNGFNVFHVTGNSSFGSSPTDAGYRLAVQSAGSNGYFSAGNFTINGNSTVTMPTGTATVGALVLPAGTVLTTPISGNIENDGTSFYYTNSSNARQTFASTGSSQTFTNKTITSSSDILGAVTMTLGSDATNDIYYRNSSGILARLAAGAAGSYLAVNSAGTALTYQPFVSGNGISIGISGSATTISSILIVGTPTVVAGTGAGTSPTVSVTSNGRQLQLTVTTGTLPTGTNATVATITLANALWYTPLPIFTPANSTTALLSGASMVYMTSTGTANVTITSGTTALTAATTYVWNIAL